MSIHFETFKPEHPLVAKYVNYYYLDIKPDNTHTAFECFPHFNTTISLYKSHYRAADRAMVFDATALPFQIFTPVREQVLEVYQKGPVYRIVIVFHPLGIQQFFEKLDFSDFIIDYPFFQPQELQDLFQTKEKEKLQFLLDQLLSKRFNVFHHSILEATLEILFKSDDNFSVEELAKQLNISRRHLNRLFKTHFGVSVKRFYEIVLLRKIIDKKLFTKPGESFTALAYELNFSDQAHLNKSFKKLTQKAPNQFFKKGTLIGDEDTFWHFLP